MNGLSHKTLLWFVFWPTAFAVSLLLPFETHPQPAAGYTWEDFEHYENITTFGYESVLCYMQWLSAALLMVPAYFRRKISVITLTVFLAVFFVLIYGMPDGSPYYPEFRSSFLLTAAGSAGIAIHAHFLAFRK